LCVATDKEHKIAKNAMVMTEAFLFVIAIFRTSPAFKFEIVFSAANSVVVVVVR